MRKGKKNPEIDASLSGLTLAHDVYREIAHAILARGGTITHIRRITDRLGLADQIAELVLSTDVGFKGVVFDMKGGVPVICDDTGIGPFNLPPTFSDTANAVHDEHAKLWQLHPSCAKAVFIAGERMMSLRRFGHTVTSKAVVSDLESQGYRPATHREACAFAEAFPTLLDGMRGHPSIVALGSCLVGPKGYLGRSDRKVAELHRYSSKWLLKIKPYSTPWYDDVFFLAVRK